ncbi:MAG: acyl-CoA dehydrogenase [Bacteroidota bacterium]
MAKEYISMRNLQFMLHEVFDLETINSLSKYQDYDSEAYDMAIAAAKDIGDQYLYPIYREMDKNKAYFDESTGTVKVHPGLQNAIKALAEGGWIGPYATYEQGGQQMPQLLLNTAKLILNAANANAASYTLLTDGASNLIRAFGSDELQEAYIPKMMAGDWQGTMALTEPQAGSSLSDITTSATLNGNGSYHIKGQKIYISGGDYETTGNVVHLTLARIEGAPAGTKGISLFVVPKYREENGELVSNDVTTAGLYGKMGQRGYVAAHLMMGEKDDCQGYLVGTPHRGLPYMFQMMNEARIGTGAMAAGTASAAYYASLQYARERPQGRHPSNKDVHAPQVLIIEHADVRRMLLFQKAIVEGSVALVQQCSYYADLAENAEGEAKENAHLVLELLTPIVKSFPSEWGNLSVSAGLQVLGGAGYTDDFPLEQYYRDIRINAIYEGTTAIHGMDILGRKVMMQKGKALQLLMEEVKADIAKAATVDALKKYAYQLQESAKTLHGTTLHLIDLAMKNRPEVFLADATLYLEFFGLVTVSWLWLKQGVAAQKALDKGTEGEETLFYQGKVHTMQYYFEYELPKIQALRDRLLSDNKLTVEMEATYLN